MWRGLILGILAAGLAVACSGGGGLAPFAESRTPPSLGERFYPPEGWAWGFLRVGEAPAQRYGVAAPATVARAQILILPDYGETAETWFETARDLGRRGYCVWVLEGAGQGGSGRTAGPRDLGYAQSFDPDVTAVLAMASAVIRAPPETHLIVLGQGVGALVAVRAAQGGLASGGLILSAPRLTAPRHAPAPRFLGLDRLRPPGEKGWGRDMPDAFARGATHDRWRGGVTLAWQRANPDLRMGDPSLRWRTAFEAAVRAAREYPAPLSAPVLVVEGDRGSGCLNLTPCSSIRLAGGAEALELERDPVRDPWLTAIDAFARSRLADRSRP
ncbi:MAG: alpha/beta hydrolase [Caulobacteraceae bacterium]|nr:alpha/beta hydrolase [Caulobacteraceae bacterium]